MISVLTREPLQGGSSLPAHQVRGMERDRYHALPCPLNICACARKGGAICRKLVLGLNKCRLDLQKERASMTTRACPPKPPCARRRNSSALLWMNPASSHSFILALLVDTVPSRLYMVLGLAMESNIRHTEESIDIAIEELGAPSTDA